MFGVHDDLVKTFTDAEWARILSRGRGALDAHGTYRRSKGEDIVLPCRNHLTYACVKQWTLVSIEDVEQVRGHRSGDS
jgi:hypothetical protein|tara:strand:+ start:250 stop:483 length:234 start_codon:yes stop_codon:yes gene_type:complete